MINTNFINYVGLVATVLGVIVTIIFGFVAYRLGKQTKSLAEKQNLLTAKQNELTAQMQPQRRFRIVIESYVPLVQAEKGVQDEIAINYKGIQVKNLASLQIEVSNRGNVPIKPEDYFRPIELSVDGMILEVRQIQSSDLDIQLAPLISSPQEAIHLNPALLNQSDSVTLLLTISEDNGTRAVDTLEVQGRLIDGSINFLRSKPTTADDVIQVSEGISADKKQPGALTASLFALADQMAQVENWSVVRDLVIILVLMTIAMAILLDAVIPF